MLRSAAARSATDSARTSCHSTPSATIKRTTPTSGARRRRKAPIREDTIIYRLGAPPSACRGQAAEDQRLERHWRRRKARGFLEEAQGLRQSHVEPPLVRAAARLREDVAPGRPPGRGTRAD